MEKKFDFKKLLKKIDYKDRRYALPAIAFPFVIIFAYQVYGLIKSDEENELNKKIITKDINDELPEIGGDNKLDRSTVMAESWNTNDDYTAVSNVQKEAEEKLNAYNNYSEEEKRRIDSLDAVRRHNEAVKLVQDKLSYNTYEKNRAERKRQSERVQETQHANASDAPVPGGGTNGASAAAAEYAKEIRRMQLAARGENEEAYRAYLNSQNRNGDLTPNERRELEQLRAKEKIEKEKAEKEKAKDNDSQEEETKIVKKAEDENENLFFSVQEKAPDDKLIKAMIDQTIKVIDGTRIRLKLIDDVMLDSVKIKKGTYLYALVNGFSGERVKANVTSILVGQKFVKVNLSLYDYDGLEGFYVPASAFREITKNVGSQAIGGANMNMNNSSGSAVSGETIALQAIQQAYSGVTSAISSEIRKNKAKIKYNTVVYLINTNAK